MIVLYGLRVCVAHTGWDDGGVAQSVGEHDERELYREPPGSGQLFDGRGRSVEHLAHDNLLIAILVVDFDPEVIVVETLGHEGIDPTG